jgi:hypothetical protein
MSNLTEILKSVAPTVATALGGPLAGAAITAIGSIFGMSKPTEENITKIFSDGKLTPEDLAAIRKLEMQYQAEEKERGFKYADLVVRDRESARVFQVQGGISKHVFWLSILLLVVTIGTEIAVLFFGYPAKVPDIVAGRILGLMDSIALMVLALYYGSSPVGPDSTHVQRTAK